MTDVTPEPDLLTMILHHNPQWLERGIIFLPTEWPHYPTDLRRTTEHNLRVMIRLGGRSVIFQILPKGWTYEDVKDRTIRIPTTTTVGRLRGPA